MYTPKHFDETDNEKIEAFIHDNGFGMLISVVDGQAQVSHIPFLYDAKQGTLTGHLARANPHWESVATSEKVFVVLQGPHAYVSPTWYSGPGVPTWNYAVVHLRGHAEIFEDPELLHSNVRALSEKYEAANEAPWNGEYNSRMLEMIVGIKIHISSIEGKFKLSQNKSLADRQAVSSMLRRAAPSEAERAAELMERNEL